jgi:type II secretion system protein N
MKIIKPILGYSLFGFSLFYFFFFWQFPYVQLQSRIVQNFEENIPLRLSIGKIQPSLFLTIHIENIRVQSESLYFQIPNLCLYPDLLGLLTEKPIIHFADAENSSRLQGTLQAEKDQRRVKIRLHHFPIQTFSGKEFIFQTQFSGEGNYQWSGENVAKGNGQAWAVMQRGQIAERHLALVPLPLTLFDNVRTEIQLAEGKPQVKRLEVSGQEMKGAWQGNLSDFSPIPPPPQKR